MGTSHPCFFFFLSFIYLFALGLSCVPWESLFRHVGSFVVDTGFLVAEHRLQSMWAQQLWAQA